jgi:hypothetical protein
MKQLLEQIRTVQQKNAARASEEYSQLVRDCADGVECDPAETLALLERAGRTAEDLERDCAWLQERRDKQALAQTLPRLLADRVRLNAAIEAEHAKVAAAIAQRDAAVKPLAEELQGLDAKQNAAERARDWLTADANIPGELQPRLRAMHARRAALGREMTELRRALSEDHGASLVNQRASLSLRLAKLAATEKRRGGVITTEGRDVRCQIGQLDKEIEAARTRLTIVTREHDDELAALESLHLEVQGL